MDYKQLKTGHIVELRDGRRGMIIRENSYGEDSLVFSSNNWAGLRDYDNLSLKWIPNSTFVTRSKHIISMDICKIYKPLLPTDMYIDAPTNRLTLIWERNLDQSKIRKLEKLIKNTQHKLNKLKDK